MTLARRIAKYAFSLGFADLDAATVHEVERRLIDSLACATGAWNVPAVAVARRVASRVTSDPGADVLGAQRPTSPDLAAFANGVLFRYLDFNDTYLSLEPAHPSDNLPAVLAAAQFAGRNGRDVVTAAVLAYEIQCRLCDAAGIRARGWDHVTYGGFSTAAAAAKLLGLDAAGIEQALNLAGTPNVALRQTRAGELSEWKGCAFANAGRNGVFAALLAAEGLTGPSPIFEGEMGFFRQVSGEFDLAGLGGPESGGGFMINRTSIKNWPAEYHSQSAIHAALELRQQVLDAGDVHEAVARIDVFSFDAAVDIIGKDPEKWRPQTRETADHSLPYCTAVALVDGDVTLESFSDARLGDERLLDLVSRTSIHRDDALTARYPQGIPNRIVVTLRNGRRIEAENEFPPGHDKNPLSDDALESKFRKTASEVLDESACNRVLEICRRLPEWTSVNELFGAFAGLETT